MKKRSLFFASASLLALTVVIGGASAMLALAPESVDPGQRVHAAIDANTALVARPNEDGTFAMFVASRDGDAMTHLRNVDSVPDRWLFPTPVDSDRRYFDSRESTGGGVVDTQTGELIHSGVLASAMVGDQVAVRLNDALVLGERRFPLPSGSGHEQRLFVHGAGDAAVALVIGEDMRFLDSEGPGQPFHENYLGTDLQNGVLVTATQNAVRLRPFARGTDGQRQITELPLPSEYLTATLFHYPCALGRTELGYLLAISKRPTAFGQGGIRPGPASLVHLHDDGSVLWEREVGSFLIECRDDDRAPMRAFGSHALVFANQGNGGRGARLLRVRISDGAVDAEAAFQEQLGRPALSPRGEATYFLWQSEGPEQTLFRFGPNGSLQAHTTLPRFTQLHHAHMTPEAAWVALPGDGWATLGANLELLGLSDRDLAGEFTPAANPIATAFGAAPR